MSSMVSDYRELPLLRDQRMVFSQLEKIQECGLLIREKEHHFFFGDADADLQAEVDIHSVNAYKQLLLEAEIGAGSSYANGEWDTPDLTAVVQIFARNLDMLDGLQHPLTQAVMSTYRAWHKLRNNSRYGSKKNIAAHYDLGNDMFSLWLDPRMQYSSAIFPDETASLSQAQTHKLTVICDKLQLTKYDHLLEIGTGWGGLACFAAKHYGCRVTTTTISEEQYAYAAEQIVAEQLTDRITLLKSDYRDLEGQYDKLVSVEMIEAVGHKHLSSYFGVIERLLKPSGRMLIQAITIADQRYDYYRNQVDFIQRFIFPGGCLPSVYEMAKHVKEQTNMTIHQIQDYSLHYAETLKRWLKQFHAVDQVLLEKGYDVYFQKLWQYYLAYCEGGFREGRLGLVHLEGSKISARRFLNTVPSAERPL